MISSLAWNKEASGVESNPILMCFRLKASSVVSRMGINLVTIRAINRVNQIKIKTLVMLNTVWNRESAIGTELAFVAGLPIPRNIHNCSIQFKKMGNIASTQRTPKKLNTKWASAARLAVVLATTAARLAVTVVPMFSPNTIEAAISKLIQPLAHITKVSAIVAEEDCIRIVSTVPINMKRI